MNDIDRAQLIFHIIQKHDAVIFISHFIITASTVFDVIKGDFLAINPKGVKAFIKTSLKMFK